MDCSNQWHSVHAIRVSAQSFHWKMFEDRMASTDIIPSTHWMSSECCFRREMLTYRVPWWAERMEKELMMKKKQKHSTCGNKCSNLDDKDAQKDLALKRKINLQNGRRIARRNQMRGRWILNAIVGMRPQEEVTIARDYWRLLQANPPKIKFLEATANTNPTLRRTNQTT